jgi:hypothetical protein
MIGFESASKLMKIMKTNWQKIPLGEVITHKERRILEIMGEIQQVLVEGE